MVLRRKSDLFLKDLVGNHIHTNYIVLNEQWDVETAIGKIRTLPDDNRIVYFYTTDSENRLTGVLPVRKLLTSSPQVTLRDIARKDLVKAKSDETLYDVAKKFAYYKYLSIPVVDNRDKVLGVIDLRTFTQKELDVSNRVIMDEIFQTIGIRISKLQTASAFRAFQLRFPWLISTITSGILCAFLASFFEATLVHYIILTFFLTLVLALGESVSIQSMTIAFQSIHAAPVTPRHFLKLFGKEIVVANFLGIFCGIIAFFIAFLLGKVAMPSLAIGLSIWMSVCCACLIGLFIPVLLHTFKLDPKIASGPITLSCADLCTMLLYLSMAAWIL